MKKKSSNRNSLINSFHSITCLSNTNSGKLAPTILIINARAVPTGNPLIKSVSIIGITPLAFEYKGMPIKTAAGTLHQSPELK